MVKRISLSIIHAVHLHKHHTFANPRTDHSKYTASLSLSLSLSPRLSQKVQLLI